MADIKHKLVIKNTPEIVYKAITTQDGIERWWCKDTSVKPEVGFVNVFTFGKFRNEMRVTRLEPAKAVAWECISSIEEWVSTTVSFDLEEQNGHTVLRFTHGGWRAVTDAYASCNYDWASFMKSLKSLCESGAGTPA